MGNRYYKYPKTFHLPFSEGLQNDDRKLPSIKPFENQEIVVTLKVDGENTSLYNDHIHARSLDSNHHPSRTFVKKLHGEISHNIPDGFRLVGENTYAKHSIFYDKLPAYFLLFNVWNEEICLSWDETVEWANILGLIHVPVLYRGIWDEEKVKACFPDNALYGEEQEGYVVRLASSFHINNFQKSTCKFVRKNHIQTNKFWMSEKIIPNLLHN